MSGSSFLLSIQSQMKFKKKEEKWKENEYVNDVYSVLEREYPVGKWINFWSNVDPAFWDFSIFANESVH